MQTQITVVLDSSGSMSKISNARETGQTGGYDESDRQRQRDIEDSM